MGKLLLIVDGESDRSAIIADKFRRLSSLTIDVYRSFGNVNQLYQLDYKEWFSVDEIPESFSLCLYNANSNTNLKWKSIKTIFYSGSFRFNDDVDFELKNEGHIYYPIGEGKLNSIADKDVKDIISFSYENVFTPPFCINKELLSPVNSMILEMIDLIENRMDYNDQEILLTYERLKQVINIKDDSIRIKLLKLLQLPIVEIVRADELINSIRTLIYRHFRTFITSK